MCLGAYHFLLSPAFAPLQERAQLERLLHVRSPSEQPEADEGHHQLFIAHLWALRRRMESILGSDSAENTTTTSSSSASSSGVADNGAEHQEAEDQESKGGGGEIGDSSITGGNRG